jgi:hypothetical protein
MSEPNKRPRMARADVLYTAMCVATMAFVVAFLLPFFMKQSIAWYYPTDRAWSFEVKPNGLAIDFYGRVLQAVFAAAACVVVTVLVAKRGPQLTDQLRRLLLAWTITTVLFGISYFAWTLAHREPAPVPLPTWYEPR